MASVSPRDRDGVYEWLSVGSGPWVQGEKKNQTENRAQSLIH